MALALAAIALAIIVAFGHQWIGSDNAPALFDATLLGPLLALMGAWIHVKRGQALGLIALGLAALLALDAVIATYFIYFLSVPVFLLVLASFGVAIRRRVSGESASA